MWSVGNWLHDWVVGGVSDWCLGEDFDKSVQGCQVDTQPL